MKASVISGNNFVYSDMEEPVLNSKGAIIKVLGCGLCGSDIVKFQHHFVKEGQVLGHEVVGEIVEINSDTNFKIGDRVAVAHHYPCFECEFCKKGHPSMCKTFKSSNIFPGGFAEFIRVDEGHLKNTIHKIPENMDLITSSFMEPVGCCHRAVKRMGDIKGQKILVIGLGSIGLLIGQVAKVYGGEVFGFDINEKRLKQAEIYGIKPAKNIDNFEADGIFLTAGADATVKSSLSAIKSGGKICVFASVKNDETGFMNNEIYYREIMVYGSYSPAPIDLKTSFELLRDKKINVKNLSVIYELKDLDKAVQDTLNGSIMKAYIRM